MAFHGKFRLKLVQLLKNHAFPSSAVDGRLGGDVVVDHKYKYGAGFRLGFIAAHRGETMVFFRTSARQHAQPSGWNTFGKRIILSPTSSKFHSGHGTETWSVSQKRAFKVHVLYDSNCSRVSTVCVWISASLCAVIDRALKFKKYQEICVQVHVTQCLKRAELAVLGCIVSAGRRNQRDSPKFSVEKNPLEFGKSMIWAWYVANSPFILISKKSLCHRKYYLIRSFIPLVYAHENLPHKHSMRC